jgi:cellobiose phosphorylase
MSIYEGLLGLRATINGIELTPNIPTDWDNVTCKRKYKNAVYNVTYKKGVDGITVNGVALQGKILPYEDGACYNIIYGLN